MRLMVDRRRHHQEKSDNSFEPHQVLGWLGLAQNLTGLP